MRGEYKFLVYLLVIMWATFLLYELSKHVPEYLATMYVASSFTVVAVIIVVLLNWVCEDDR